jgi:hypothetical protein
MRALAESHCHQLGQATNEPWQDVFIIRCNLDQRYVHIVVDHSNGSQKFHDLAFRSVHAERLDQKPIQSFEIDLGDRRIRSGGHRINEALDGVLGDDHLINC